MIIFADSRSEQMAGPFLRWLEKQSPVDRDLFVQIAPDESHALQSPDGGHGFAVFVPADGTMFSVSIPALLRVCGREADEALYQFRWCLAHEYRHFTQFCNGQPYDEQEADEFGHAMAKEFEPAPKEAPPCKS